MTQYFRRAIVRHLSKSYKKCISNHPDLLKLSLSKAETQHQQYIDVLKELGLEIIILDQDPTQPDCCFVEDNAVIFRKKALITNMGAVNRRSEIKVVASQLEDMLPTEYMDKNATLDGGDVINLEDRFICGVSSRTNKAGAEFLGEYFNVSVDIVEDPHIVHLKSYASYLGNNTMVCTSRYADHEVFAPFNKIIIPVEEEYAANMINVNDTIMIADGYPKTKQLLKDSGFDIVELSTTEFQKCEGALTCLSLRF